MISYDIFILRFELMQLVVSDQNVANKIVSFYFHTQNFSGRFDTSGSMIAHSVPEISPDVGFCDEDGRIGYSSSWIVYLFSISVPRQT